MNIPPEDKPTGSSEHRENSTSDNPSPVNPATEEELAAMLADVPDAGAEVTIESLQAQLADAEKRVLMAHADLENFRRRTRRDLQDQIKYAPLSLITDILESVDNLDRAVESYEKDPNVDGLVEGVKLVAQQISTTLENNGCKKIDAAGHPFDPNLHQALQMQPSNEYPANTVMMDLRPGFQLHDRVIRPTQVFVSTGPESGNEG